MAAEVVEKGIVLKAQDGRLVVGVKRARRGLYGRITERTTKLYADDAKRQAGVGDTVLIRFSRPISSSKRWRLTEVVTKVSTIQGVQDA
jgi:small subunit ribosomal protein S17